MIGESTNHDACAYVRIMRGDTRGQMIIFWETYRFDVRKRACHQIFESSQAGHSHTKYTNAHVVYQLPDRVLFGVGTRQALLALAPCRLLFAAAACVAAFSQPFRTENGFNLLV